MEPGDPIGIACQSCGDTFEHDGGEIVSCNCTEAPVDVLYLRAMLPSEWVVVEARLAPHPA